MAAEERLRALGTYERFRVTLHDLGYHYNVGVTGIYSCPTKLATNHQHLFFQSIREAILIHPNLTLQIRETDDGIPIFVRLSRFTLQEVVHFIDPPSEEVRDYPGTLRYLERLLSSQHSLRFSDSSNPLWRILVVSLGSTTSEPDRWRCAVVFIYHHVIADGRSGQAMHSTIVKALNRCYSEKSRLPATSSTASNTKDSLRGGQMIESPSQPISASMEELIEYRRTWKSYFTSAFHRYAPCFQKGFRLQKWAGSQYHREGLAETQTRIRLISIGKNETEYLQSLCRVHKSSVTALLQVVVSSVLFEQFKNAKVLKCATAISLRRFFPKSLAINDSKMGLWIDAFFDIFTYNEVLGQNQHSETLPWQTIRRCKKHIDREISYGLDDLSFAGLQDSAQTFESQLLSQLGKDRQNSYSITNLGQHESCFPEVSVVNSETWRIEQLFLSQSAHVNGSAIQFCFVSSKIGGMSISLNWQEGTVSNSDVDAIVGRLAFKLQYLGRGCVSQESGGFDDGAELYCSTTR